MPESMTGRMAATRRDVMKLGLAAGVGATVPAVARAQSVPS